MKKNGILFGQIFFLLLQICLPLSIFSQSNTNKKFAAGPVLSPRIANYAIDVKLDTEKHLLSGSEVLTWRNTSRYDIPDLRFHLYYNAWLNDKSSFLSRLNSYYRLAGYGKNDWAYCKVKSIKIKGTRGWRDADLTQSMKYIQPDDMNSDDKTVMEVQLPRLIRPGESIEIEIEWQSKVPRTFARTGTIDEYYFLGQWFPKIGVLQDDGLWNCHQFIGTEFFSDYGVYDVKMTVPKDWIVGATGEEVDRTQNDSGTVMHHYYQADVHDFAWTTSPHFRVFTDRFEETGLPATRLRLLLMPDHLDKKERYFQATKTTLKYYGTWFGPYPYGHLTIIDPAYQSRTGGMEYPTLFTGGTRWLSPKATLSPEGVTVHECGHQFWYGIVGNNEFENAWLDEGFNTYSQSRAMEVAYPPRTLDRRYLDGFLPVLFPGIHEVYRSQGAERFDGFESGLKLDRMSRDSWQQAPGAYRINAYNKPALMLQTLENYLGWDLMQKIMSTYFERWKFKHPRPEDFFRVVNEISSLDMSWFFEQTYNSSNVFDYAVGSVRSQPVRATLGYVEEDGLLQFEEPSEEAAGDTNQAEVVPPQFKSTIIVRRWGEAIFPVEIKMTFANGDTLLERWDGSDRWARFDYVRPEKLVKVEVDPRGVLVLDINRTNNTWSAKPQARIAAYKWTGKWMIWLQSMLQFFTFFS